MATNVKISSKLLKEIRMKLRGVASTLIIKHVSGTQMTLSNWVRRKSDDF